MEKLTFTKEQSSNIAVAEYNAEKQALYLQFHSGGRYLYLAVSLPTWEGFKLASSKGQYFHDNIKGKFTFERIW